MYLIEQLRVNACGSEWVLLKQTDCEPEAIAFYIRTRTDFPDWKLRRLTVNESSHPDLRAYP